MAVLGEFTEGGDEFFDSLFCMKRDCQRNSGGDRCGHSDHRSSSPPAPPLIESGNF